MIWSEITRLSDTPTGHLATGVRQGDTAKQLQGQARTLSSPKGWHTWVSWVQAILGPSLLV